jgi:uncharacterized membrane protein YphA (DoxX/SURF4 family)
VLNRTEDVALLVARLLVAALLLPSGIDKLLHFSRFVASLGAREFLMPSSWRLSMLQSKWSGRWRSSWAYGRCGRPWS